MLTSPLLAYCVSGISKDAVSRVSALIVTSAMRVSTAGCLLIAGLLLVAGCGHKSAADQMLRTCVDRWNEANMVDWAPAAVNVAFRRPNAKEHSSIQLAPQRQCIVSIDAGRGTWTCVLADSGAYWCPPLHEPTGLPLTN